MKHILLVSEYFWPDTTTTGKFLGDLFQQLKKNNKDLEITVLTGSRLYNYSNEESNLPYFESFEGISVRRLKVLRNRDSGFLIRLISDLLFSLKAMINSLRVDFQVLFVVTNPPLMPFVMLFINKLRKKKAIYLIHDLYPDVMVALSIARTGSPFVLMIRILQKKALSFADRVLVLGKCMKRYVEKSYGIADEKIVVASNWHTIEPKYPSEASKSDTMKLIYTGNIGQFHDFDILVDAAAELKGKLDFQLLVAGEGYKKKVLIEEVKKKQLDNFTIIDFLPIEEFSSQLSSAWVGIVTLEKNMESLGVPSKIYNYMAVGLPLLAIMGPDSDVSHLIDGYEVGYRIDHGDVAALVELIKYLHSHPQELLEKSKNAYNYAVNEASLAEIVKRYRDIIDSL